MGIQNRDYLKDEPGWNGGGYGANWQSKSQVVKLIIVTAAVFLLQILTSRSADGSAVTDWLSLEAGPLFRQGQIWRLLTYAFCHSQRDLLHIVMNMYMLYVIGTVVCSLTGDREFFWFYICSAIFAGICSVSFYVIQGIDQVTRQDDDVMIIGASGAVMAVFMLFALHYPRQKMLMFGIVPIEVRWLLALYVVFDGWPVLKMLAGGAVTSRVAHSAHLGGLLFGYLYFRWNMRICLWWDSFAGRLPKFRRSSKNLRVFNPEAQPAADISEKVDEILEKISREGEASLTARERNILTQASRKLRKDRQ
jgi:membrane associated rhomboid family serine protease